MKIFKYFFVIALLGGSIILGVESAKTQPEAKAPEAKEKPAVAVIPEAEETPVVATTTEPAKPKLEITKYTVASGDTISSIAKKFGITVATVLTENNLTDTSMIKPGDVLSILPFSGVTYTVKSGDSIAKIASSTNVQIDAITKANEISTDSDLKAGQVLMIPGGTKQTAAVAIKKVAAAPKTTTYKTSVSSTASGPISTSGGSISWTSAALSELRKIPSSTVRASVKTKINNYAKAHNITVITKDVYLSIEI